MRLSHLITVLRIWLTPAAAAVRQVLILVAVISALANGGGLRLHTLADEQHQTCVAAHAHDDHSERETADPHGDVAPCADCHCPTSILDLPPSLTGIESAASASIRYALADDRLPPTLTFQPDPPPVRS